MPLFRLSGDAFSPARDHFSFDPARVTVALGALLSLWAVAGTPAFAQYVETETNDTKATANVFNLGTATSATISGTSATSADQDYFRINTAYQTAGIYVNQLQLNDTSQFIGSIRAQTQTAGTINSGTDAVFQSSQRTGTATPYGFDQYYSFGGAGKTQAVTYKVVSGSATSGGSYTATFTSSRLSASSITNIGNVSQGRINFAALANIGSSGTATDTAIVVFDSNYNLYYDNIPSSSTFGYAASNNNPASGVSGFALNRSFQPGTYYFAIGINNVATNDAAAPDDAVRGNGVLDYDNVVATSNTFYNGNNGNTRPSDFQVTDTYGRVVYTSSGQVVPSLYALNFYSVTVVAVPEPASFLLGAGPLGLCLLGLARRRRAKVNGEQAGE